ncbi:isoprenylcysteine carboxyl methyltransferase family protein [Mycobacterium xenopi 4042]|uniref:Isoprenylcysteine carboxyl methyltransferase family protein n=1 Tax=Mycobacterium xenopi 4042 TaxID=1299334 RepID=X8DYU3_MYCXE|nr:isoprenylcysteine carboxyl methyltransferase family protein [Mycobacterium xenopi 4042]
MVGLSQALRWWCVTTLGRRWNTLVIVVPQAHWSDAVRIAGFATPTTWPWWLKVWRCRWCTPRG